MGRSLLSLQMQEPSAAGKPWVVLIHGLGMSHRSWIDPFGEKLLGGAFSFDYVLTDLPHPPGPSSFRGDRILAYSPPLRLSRNPPLSFWEFLRREGYGILTWSQQKSRGPIEDAVEELQIILEAMPYGEKKVLLGHSRGGLVARKYLQEYRRCRDRISGVVLMGVPNHGSRIAKSAEFFVRAPFSFLFRGGNHPISGGLPKRNKGFISLLVRTLAAYTSEGGIKELAPRSAFMRRLASKEGKEQGNKIPYFNLIGNRTDFIRIYLRSSPAAKAIPLFSLLDGLEKIFPRSFLPPEVLQGRGDGQVSVRSAILDWAGKTQTFPLNHAQFLVSTEVQKRVRHFLEAI